MTSLLCRLIRCLLASVLTLASLGGLSGCGKADAGPKARSEGGLGGSGASGGYTETRYPIVLVHGYLGFDNIGSIEYFRGIPAALQSGGATVFTPQVSALNSTEVRGEQLLLEVQRIIAVTGESKVHLIGHSHGGPTARYVASVRPDLVASVTSVGGVNKGSLISDILIGNSSSDPFSDTVRSTIANAFGKLLSLLSGRPDLPQDEAAAQRSLSSAGAARFNATHPQGVPLSACGEGAFEVDGVYYFSWSGGSTLTNVLDPLDPVLALTGLAFGSEKNDGLVSTCSSRLGDVIRDDYPINHLDQVNHIAGLVNPFAISPVTLFRQHANRLKGLGL